MQVSNDNRFPDGTFSHYWDPFFCIEQTLTGLKPKTWYELSLWAKSTNAISFLFGADGPDWYSDYLPLNCPTWQRFAVKFRTEDKETTKKIFLRTFNLADEVLIDDIAVVEAAEPQVFVYCRHAPAMTKTQVARLGTVKSRAVAAESGQQCLRSRWACISPPAIWTGCSGPDIQKKQTDYWTWLQLREVAWVLDATEALIRQPLPDVPPIPFDHPKIDRGVFVAGTPPCPIFYGGYMGIHSDEDDPEFCGNGRLVHCHRKRSEFAGAGWEWKMGLGGTVA